eukprot:g24493.t1
MAFGAYPGEGYHLPPYLDEPYGYPPYAPGPQGSSYANGYKPHQPGPLTVVANSSVLSGDSTLYPWYRVAFLGGIDLRRGPHIDAPRVGITLGQNATFAASEDGGPGDGGTLSRSLPQPDGRVYLRLADGRGWAFDDSALYPHDPVVIRGFWSPIGPGNSPPKTDLAALQPPPPQPLAPCPAPCPAPCGQPAGARGRADWWTGWTGPGAEPPVVHAAPCGAAHGAHGAPPSGPPPPAPAPGLGPPTGAAGAAGAAPGALGAPGGPAPGLGIPGAAERRSFDRAPGGRFG